MTPSLIEMLIDAFIPNLGYSLAEEVAGEVDEFVEDNLRGTGMHTSYELRVELADGGEFAITRQADGDTSVETRTKRTSDMWFSARGWCIGRTLCTAALTSDEYTAVIVVHEHNVNP